MARSISGKSVGAREPVLSGSMLGPGNDSRAKRMEELGVREYGEAVRSITWRGLSGNRRFQAQLFYQIKYEPNKRVAPCGDRKVGARPG